MKVRSIRWDNILISIMCGGIALGCVFLIIGSLPDKIPQNTCIKCKVAIGDRLYVIGCDNKQYEPFTTISEYIDYNASICVIGQ